MNDQKAKTSDAATNPGDSKASGHECRKRRCRLSYRDRLFVEYYLANGGFVAPAARALGYRAPCETGRRKLKRPEVQALIQQRLESIGVNRDEVVGSLVMIMRTHAGSSDPAMQANALAAATELMKIFGLDKTRWRGPKTGPVTNVFHLMERI